MKLKGQVALNINIKMHNEVYNFNTILFDSVIIINKSIHSRKDSLWETYVWYFV